MVIRLFAVIVALAVLFAPPVYAADTARLAAWTEGGDRRADHSEWARFLDRYVVDSADGVTRVRYGAVAAEDRRALDGYIDALAATDPTAFARDEAFAYWANLYNALTVDLILDRYPVRSIRDIKPNPLAISPWKIPVVTVLGERLALDDIEHGVLRAAFKGPRVHYAVNCASISCPNLRKEPFAGQRLDAQLDEAARDYVNHPRGARFDEQGRLVASSIYDWFQEDFGGSEGGVIEHLSLYAEPALLERLHDTADISKYKYDWSLNDAD